MNEVIFAQDVPDTAKKLYKLGTKDLQSDPKKGQQELEEAIKAFPDYYDALNALGCNYVDSKEYQKSLPYLIHAIDLSRIDFHALDLPVLVGGIVPGRLRRIAVAQRDGAIQDSDLVQPLHASFRVLCVRDEDIGSPRCPQPLRRRVFPDFDAVDVSEHGALEAGQAGMRVAVASFLNLITRPSTRPPVGAPELVLASAAQSLSLAP